MPLEVVNSAPPLTLSEVEELEGNLEIRLPHDYVQFLLKHNGGEFAEKVEYPLIETPPRGTGGFEFFTSIERDEDGELWLYEPPDVDMSDLFCIADDGTGMICLACSGNNCGKVYFVDSDRGLKHWFCLVANSFTEFLESIRPFSES